MIASSFLLALTFFAFAPAAHAQFGTLTQSAPMQAPLKFNSTASTIIVTPPTGAKRVLIKAWAAGGGGGGAGLSGGADVVGGNGGAGGYLSAIVPLNGANLFVTIGKGGIKGPRQASNSMGFGGTGGTDTVVGIGTTNAIRVGAGGGGGGGGKVTAAIGGAGGNGGSVTANAGAVGVGTTVPQGGQGANGAAHGGVTSMSGYCPNLVVNTSSGPASGGGICYQGSQAITQIPGVGFGIARYSTDAGSFASGGGGGLGTQPGAASGGGGQGTNSANGSGAGGGGGSSTPNLINFPTIGAITNLKSAAGTVMPPNSLDIDYNGVAGKGGSGANVSGAAGGNGGDGLVVLYFYAN